MQRESDLAEPEHGGCDSRSEDYAPIVFIVFYLSILGGLAYWFLKG